MLAIRISNEIQRKLLQLAEFNATLIGDFNAENESNRVFEAKYLLYQHIRQEKTVIRTTATFLTSAESDSFSHATAVAEEKTLFT